MCNLYSVTKGQSAIRDLFSVKHDRAGNLPPLPAIFPDQMALIVRSGADGERELVMPYLNTCFLQATDFAGKLAKFAATWHYASQNRIFALYIGFSTALATRFG
jgi:hypothetical protein